MADFDPAVAERYNQLLAQDPEYQRLFQEAAHSYPGSDANGRLSLYLKAKGLSDNAYAVNPTTGRIEQHRGVWEQMPGWAKAASIGTWAGAAAPFALNALGVGGGGTGLFGGAGGQTAGTAGTVAAGDYGPTISQLGAEGTLADPAAEGVTSAIGSSGGVPQTLGGVGPGASKAGSVLSGIIGTKGPGLIPNLINIGSRVGGALLGSHAAGKAAQQQERAVQAALDLQKDLYGQSRAALMPYYQLGAGSLGRLGSFLGTQPAAPIPDGTLRTLGGK